MHAMNVVPKSVFESLTNINDVRAASEEDTQVFQELYQVLEKHNALRRFGITL